MIKILGVGAVTCNQTQNGTVPIYHDARFGVDAFWLVLTSMMAVSGLSFLIINVKFKDYFVSWSSPASIDSSLSVESGKDNCMYSQRYFLIMKPYLWVSKQRAKYEDEFVTF